ncbi:hypothetical protein ACEQ8H_002492 [Pleosporales sp. CAS-2024a]
MSFLQWAQLVRPGFHAPARARAYAANIIPYNFSSIFSNMAGAGAAASLHSGSFPATPYKPRHETWPYDESDFVRHDESDDGVFYRPPRLVTHIDDASMARLSAYYGTVLPTKGCMMDLCTSWKSFYPSETNAAIQRKDLAVYGVGLNAQEMKRNGALDEWRVLDLNKPPHDVRAGWANAGAEMKLDATTCVVSIDYLNKPLEICRNVLDATNEGGKIHLVISNRCFPTKVVRRWLMLSEQQRLEFVGGWKDIEIVDLCARDESGMRITDDHGTIVVRSPHLPDHLDPLWVVRGTKHSGS